MKLNFKEKYLILLVLTCFISIGFYYSYAIFVTKQLQENIVVVKTENNTISLKVNEGNEKVTISPKEETVVTLSFTNTNSSDYYYMVLVKGIKTGVKVSSNDLITGLIKSGSNKEIKVNINNETSELVELTFLVQINNNENFDKEMGYSYINIDENYDHTRANKPELGNLKLIPVSYQKTSDTSGYWYKTDVNNSKSIWYDYDNGIWANAVLVSDAEYKKYQNKDIGTEIEIGDILGFYVWIPSFKYYVINNNNYTSYERTSNIIFEKNSEKTGTIICNDKISTLDDSHIYSEVCYDNVYQHIYDNLSTYTHPAFKDRNGFWVSKFLIGEGEKSLPNVSILKKNIEEANNIGKKTNSHVLTNMEYSAVILLSNSLYGKSGNTLYNGDNTSFERIYVNAYKLEITGCSSEYSMYSKSFQTAKSDKCIEYNNVTNLTHYSNSVYYPIGYVGAGASSTGEVYGVYDLANLSGEVVASFVASSSGKVSTNLKYYDTYSYNDYIGKVYSSSNIYNLYRYKLGDTIKEHFRSLNESGLWNNGMLIQNKNSGVLIRGGISVYSTLIEDVDYKAPFRFVLN